jgi:hypothetical protein
MNSWTNCVGSLRSRWSNEHTTTPLDIKRAVEIARACFEGLDTADVALLLLAFKNRKLRGPIIPTPRITFKSSLILKHRPVAANLGNLPRKYLSLAI